MFAKQMDHVFQLQIGVSPIFLNKININAVSSQMSLTRSTIGGFDYMLKLGTNMYFTTRDLPHTKG